MEEESQEVKVTMKCRFCGCEVPEEELYCKNCGREVFAVPEYNPLDDMLTAQIKVGVNSGEDEEPDYLDDISDGVRRTPPSRRNTKNVRNTSSGRKTSDRERRRRQAERRRAALRRKRRRLLTAMVLVIAAVAAACFALYRNSYSGLIHRGYKALDAKEYSAAQDCFEKALAKNEKKPEAYSGLSAVYIRQDQLAAAEELFDRAIEEQPENADIYEAYIEYFLDTDQQMSIPVLLDDAQDSVQEKLSDYIVEEPEYSLDEDEVYDEVCQLELSTDADAIYYTVDGEGPTVKSTKYTEPIQLEEGENVIKAIAVNDKGVPSLTSEKTYVIEFPVEDAPAISPSTGQYESAQQIEIKVPEGYEAYYTTDGSEPTTASTKYTGPIDMPEGETLFKAILVNGGGRTSGVTTRNYMLDIESSE